MSPKGTLDGCLFMKIMGRVLYVAVGESLQAAELRHYPF